MQTRRSQLLPFLILAATLLAPGRASGGEGKPPAGQPAGPATPAAGATTTRVSVSSEGEQGNGWSSLQSISADGRLVAFYSDASNLVEGDTNELSDIYVYDMQTGKTERISVASDGSQADSGVANTTPSISTGGRYIAFQSSSGNLVIGDNNDENDIFVKDRQTGNTERISVASDGDEGDNDSFDPKISADGRYVAFGSSASNLVDGDTSGIDVFVRDRKTGITERISLASDGSEGDGNSYAGSISGDGRYVTFFSYSSNLVGNDTNGTSDVFLHDQLTGNTSRISVATDGGQGNGPSYSSSISYDGRFIAFDSYSTNLVPYQKSFDS